MSKKMYIPVSSNGRNYKLYMDDIYKIHSRSKLIKPSIPHYHYSDLLHKF
jgi:hypothetical protein